MVKLPQIRGSKVLPVKKESPKGKHCNCEAWTYIECGCGADWSDYDKYNEAVSTIEQVSVEVDVEELAKLLCPMLFEINWEDAVVSTKASCIRHAKLIAQSKQKWLKLERVEERNL